MSCRAGLCAHYHYLLGIVNPDPLTGLDGHDGITIPRTIAHGWPGIGGLGKRVPSFIRLVFAVNLLEERG
jgi:hypothetical protein